MAAQKCKKHLFGETVRPYGSSRSSRQLFLPEIISKLAPQTFDVYRSNQDLKFRPKSLSNLLRQMS